MIRGALAVVAAAIIFAGPAAAAEMVATALPKAFQGRWVAAGPCDAANDVQGGLIEVGPTGLKSYQLSCTFTRIAPADDPQNRRFTLHRVCDSAGKKSDADIELYLVESEPLGDVLVSVNAGGAFLTLYKRCNGP